MTIIVVIKYLHGTIIATDSRVTYGDMALKRDQDRKIHFLNEKVALTSVGLTGACDRITREIKACAFPSSQSFDEMVTKCEDIMWDFYKRNKDRIEASDEEEDWAIQLVSSDRIVDIGSTGFSQEEPKYLCEGSGKPYAEYILQQRYKEKLTEQECKELAVYAVLQTSRIDPNVGGPINIAIIDENGLRYIQKEDIDEIVENLVETPAEVELEIQKLVNQIVQERRWINNAFRAKFKSDLFKQNEAIISEIQRGCKNENDFTSRIAALSLMIDDMQFPKTKQESNTKTEGSINKLIAFAEKNMPKLEPECISIFRDIHTLRSKKMPIHKDDPKVIQVLLTWEYKIPPNWSSLWLKALTKYRDSLLMLKKALT